MSLAMNQRVLVIYCINIILKASDCIHTFNFNAGRTTRNMLNSYCIWSREGTIWGSYLWPTKDWRWTKRDDSV